MSQWQHRLTILPRDVMLRKIALFDRSRCLLLRRFIDDNNVFPSATVVRVHDGALAEEYAMLSTIWLSWKSVYHTYGSLQRYMYDVCETEHLMLVVR